MICLNPIEATREQIVETAGQPLPRTEVSVRSPENNQVIPIGEVGEICARSYGVMIGYNDNAEATTAAIDGDGCSTQAIWVPWTHRDLFASRGG